MTVVGTARAGTLDGAFDSTLGLYVPASFAADAELLCEVEVAVEGADEVDGADDAGDVDGPTDFDAFVETGKFVGEPACEPPFDLADDGTFGETLEPSAERDIIMYPSQMH